MITQYKIAVLRHGREIASTTTQNREPAMRVFTCLSWLWRLNREVVVSMQIVFVRQNAG